MVFTVFAQNFFTSFPEKTGQNTPHQPASSGRCGGGAFAIAEWQIFGVPGENLAQGIVPSGSSDSKWGRFAATWTGREWTGRIPVGM